MKKLVKTVLTAAMVYAATPASAQAWQWATTSGGAGIKTGHSVFNDASGNSYVGGDFSGTSCVIGSTTLSNTSSTTNDGFLAKYNSSGVAQWAVKAGGTGDEYITEVVTDGTNVYAAGRFSGTTTFYSTNATTTSLTSSGSSDVFLAKYNASGVIQWAVKYGGTGAELATDLAISTAQQRLYISGIGGTSTFFALSYSYATTPTTPAFTYSNSAGNAKAYGIAADASGNSYILASYYGSLASVTLPSGTYTGNNGMLLIKLGLTGTTTWVQNIGNGSTGDEEGRVIELDGSDNVYIGGEYYGTANISGNSLTNATSTIPPLLDVFVAKYTNAGAVLWAKKLSSGGNQHVNAMLVSSVGDAYVYIVNGENSSLTFGCQSFPSVNGNTDNKVVIAKFSPIGLVKGAAAPVLFDNSGTAAMGICLGSAGTLIHTGRISGSAGANFGGATVTSSNDMFVAKFMIYDEIPVVPNTDVHICGIGSSASLFASGYAGSTIKWYNSSMTYLASGSTYNTPAVSVLSSTVYYVSSTVLGCESARVPVTVTAHAINKINARTDTTICNGSCVTMRFTNATTALVMPDNVVRTSPFVVCPTATTQYILTNTVAGYCQVSDTVNVTVLVTDPFSGSYSAAVGLNGTQCVPSSPPTYKPICSTPVISDATMPSGTLAQYRCGIATTTGWMGARSVGMADINITGTSYTVEVYQVDGTGVRSVISGTLAPNIFQITGADIVGAFSFNDPGFPSGFNSAASPFYSDGSLDPTGAAGNGDYFRDFYSYAVGLGATALTELSSRIFCVDIRQITDDGCTVNQKSFFRIANNGVASGGNYRIATAGEVTEETVEYMSLEVFPNPTTGIVNISLNADDKNVQVTVTDNLGKQVMKTNNLESNHGELNMETLPAGIYFYNVIKNNTSYKGKIVKQ